MNINYEISDDKAVSILEQKCAYHGITTIPTTLEEKEALLNKLLLAENMQLYAAVEREKAVAPVYEVLQADVEIKAAEDALKAEISQGINAMAEVTETVSPVKK
jgi:hypothetical protein